MVLTAYDCEQDSEISKVIIKLRPSTQCDTTGVGMTRQKMTDISTLFVSVLCSCSQDQKMIRPSVSMSIRFIFEMFLLFDLVTWSGESRSCRA